jgi:hypothetical protein
LYSPIKRYKVFEHIDMLFQGIQLQPYTVIFILFGSDFGVLGHMSRVVWLSLSDVRVAKVRFAVDVEAHAVTIATHQPNRINIHHSIVNPEPSHQTGSTFTTQL